MIGAYSPYLECVAKRNSAANKLKDRSDSDLINLIEIILKKPEKIDYLTLSGLPVDSDIYMAAGAADVLRDRYGQDYVSQITKVRPAKTLKEHLIHFFTGRMFPVKKTINSGLLK